MVDTMPGVFCTCFLLPSVAIISQLCPVEEPFVEKEERLQVSDL